jgi:hypothetical protein
MVSSGLSALVVHTLLNHRPFPVISDDEPVQIEIKPIL